MELARKILPFFWLLLGSCATQVVRLPSSEKSCVQLADELLFKLLVDEAHKPFVLNHGRKTKLAVVMVHAVGKSPAQMKKAADFYYSKGINVISVLLEGHGTSRLAFDEFLSDTSHIELWKKNVLDGVKYARENLGKKVIVLGYSAGATTATLVHLENPGLISGLAMQSPMIAYTSTFDRLMKAQITKYEKWKALSGSIQGKNNPYQFLPNKKYPNTPWYTLPEFEDEGYTNPSINAYAFVEALMADLHKKLKKQRIRIPVYIMWSEADRMASSGAVDEFRTHLLHNNYDGYLYAEIDLIDHMETMSGPVVDESLEMQLFWLEDKLGFIRPMVP